MYSKNSSIEPLVLGKKVAILQSNYIPWKGYFDLINLVDEFILYDDAQYTKRDWRNRNKIKTDKGLLWLTVPIEVKGKFTQRIREAVISSNGWNQKHWETITHYYSRAKYFRDFKKLFEEIYLSCHERFLSQLNYRLIRTICDILGIKTKISWSMDYNLVDGKTERLLDLCKQSHATEYVSGPAAKEYLDEETFREAGISLKYMDYSNYPEYEQLYSPFEHQVSIIDLILNEGPNAPKYMKSF